MNAQITEVFSSVQGEGIYAGQKHLFVRFAGCPLNCIWCDTPASKKETPSQSQELSVVSLMEQLRSLWEPCAFVSLTGGEPLVQSGFIKDLCVPLKKEAMPVFLETNGILVDALAEVIEGVDVVSMDFKLPSATQCAAHWEEHEAFLKEARKKEVYVKAVITLETVDGDIETAVDIIRRIDRNIPFILQPNFLQMKEGILEKCLEFQRQALPFLHDVRVLPQFHQMLNIR